MRATLSSEVAVSSHTLVNIKTAMSASSATAAAVTKRRVRSGGICMFRYRAKIECGRSSSRIKSSSLHAKDERGIADFGGQFVHRQPAAVIALGLLARVLVDKRRDCYPSLHRRDTAR